MIAPALCRGALRRAAAFASLWLLGSATCLSDGIPEALRRNLTNANGESFKVGLQMSYDDSFMSAAVAGILIEEKLGFHTRNDSVTSVRDIHRLLQGCVDPQNPATCVANITYWHVSLGLWGTKGWDTIQPGGMVPENLGSMGYRRFEGIFVKENLWDASIPPMVSLETHLDLSVEAEPWRFLDNIYSVDTSLLERCSVSYDFQDTFMIQNYLNITFDYGGVIYDPVLEDYVGYCPDDYFWLAPGCRDGNETLCFPHFTYIGWLLEETMQKATIWNIPMAIAQASTWSNYWSLPQDTLGTFYWWKPSTEFLLLNPRVIRFPSHDATGWENGDKSTEAARPPAVKIVSQDLSFLSPEVHQLVGRITLDMQMMDELLLNFLHAYDWRDAACQWLNAHTEVWQAWLPDTTTTSSSTTSSTTTTTSNSTEPSTTSPSTVSTSTIAPSTTSPLMSTSTTSPSSTWQSTTGSTGQGTTPVGQGTTPPGTTTPPGQISKSPVVVDAVVSNLDPLWYSMTLSAMQSEPENAAHFQTDAQLGESTTWIVGLPNSNTMPDTLTLASSDGMPSVAVPRELLQRGSPSGLLVTEFTGESSSLPSEAQPGATVDFGGTSMEVSTAVVDVSLLDLRQTGASVVDVHGLANPIFIRLSDQDTFSADSPCAFLNASNMWSQEGVYRAIPGTSAQADTSGAWCASTHLSLFALLIPPAPAVEIECTTLDTLFGNDPSCFQPAMLIGLVLGVLAFCCCLTVLLCCFRCRRVTAGRLKLQDQQGGAYEFQFKVAKEITHGIGGVAERPEDDGKTKIVVKWDVDLEQAQQANFEFEKGRSGSALNVTGTGILLTEAASPDIKKIGSETPKSVRSRKLSEAEEEAELSEVEATSEIKEWDHEDFLVEVDVDSPDELKRTKSGIGYEAYGDEVHIEYFSSTHQKWIQGCIDGIGRLGDGEAIPTYTILLKLGGLHRQKREFVDLSLLREPFKQNCPVSVQVGKEWLPGLVSSRQALPLGYTVNLLENGSYNLSGKSVTAVADQVRPRFPNGQAVEVYRGVTLGWFPGVARAEKDSESGWPKVSIEMAPHWEADTTEVVSCFHYHVRILPGKIPILESGQRSTMAL